MQRGSSLPAASFWSRTVVRGPVIGAGELAAAPLRPDGGGDGESGADACRRGLVQPAPVPGFPGAGELHFSDGVHPHRIHYETLRATVEAALALLSCLEVSSLPSEGEGTTADPPRL